MDFLTADPKEKLLKAKEAALQSYLAKQNQPVSSFDAFSKGASSLFSSEEPLENQTAQAQQPEAYVAGQAMLPLSVPASAAMELYKRYLINKGR